MALKAASLDETNVREADPWGGAATLQITDVFAPKRSKGYCHHHKKLMGQPDYECAIGHRRKRLAMLTGSCMSNTQNIHKASCQKDFSACVGRTQLLWGVQTPGHCTGAKVATQRRPQTGEHECASACGGPLFSS